MKLTSAHGKDSRAEAISSMHRDILAGDTVSLY